MVQFDRYSTVGSSCEVSLVRISYTVGRRSTSFQFSGDHDGVMRPQLLFILSMASFISYFASAPMAPTPFISFSTWSETLISVHTRITCWRFFLPFACSVFYVRIGQPVFYSARRFLLSLRPFTPALRCENTLVLASPALTLLCKRSIGRLFPGFLFCPWQKLKTIGQETIPGLQSCKRSFLW